MNFIMGSRLIYGMSRHALLPKFSVVHATRQTPHRAILVLGFIVALLAFAGNIKVLASATSLLLLLVFALMNVSLLVLKMRPDEEGRCPPSMPVLGFLICAALVVSRVLNASGEEAHAPLIALAMIAGVAVMFFIVKPAGRNFAESEA